MITPSPDDTTKFRKLETAASHPNHQNRSSDVTADRPVALRLTIKNYRLVLLSTAVVAIMVALVFGVDDGVVLKTFARRDVSIKDQEKLVERYNSYSGTVTGALERPIELFLAVVMQVVVLRLLAEAVLSTEKRWYVAVVAMALGAGSTYLMTNGLSAVNVQAREQPIQAIITTEDLTTPAPDTHLTTTMNQSFSEVQDVNPITNTILRNLVLPRAARTKQVCSSSSRMEGEDDIVYRIPSHSWTKDLAPTARKTTSIRMVISENPAANVALSPDQIPMNASDAAELLLYSYMDRGNAPWGSTTNLIRDDLGDQIRREANQTGKFSAFGSVQVPSTRLTNLLPPTLVSSELQDREWFLKHAGPTMYNISDPLYKNSSLQRNWSMTFSRIEIEPGVVWVDTVTIEREVASPQLQTNTTKDGTRYYELSYDTNRLEAVKNWFIPRANDSVDERIDVASGCSNGTVDLVMSSLMSGSSSMVCDNRSSNSLLVVATGRRLVADAVIANASVLSGKLVRSQGNGVIVNMREIFSETVARISWNTQDLSTVYNAKCTAAGGCLGLDVALPGSGQRLVVSANALPVSVPPQIVSVARVTYTPLSVVSVRRPQHLYAIDYASSADRTEFIGDVLLAHNVRSVNASSYDPNPASSECVSLSTDRMTTYVNNHIYMESTLQPAYTVAAMYLLQSGVPQDIVNQTWTTHRMLAFSGNQQDVKMYVYMPRLNKILSLVGCGVLLIAIAVVVFFPYFGLRGTSDPLAGITTPHVIANIVFDESAFPPLLLTRTVVPSDTTPYDADALMIESISLQRQEINNEHPAATSLV